MALLRDKRILVTGCSGTVGSELVKQLLSCSDHGPSMVIGIDNNESELFFTEQLYHDDERAHFFLSDICDYNEVSLHTRNVDIIFHTAAYKHVAMCERSPMGAVTTNILGLQNIINAARESNVERVIFTSSDKAVNPTNVMGTSKLMGERLITAANNTVRHGGTIFSSTRFGNVLGSRGSVLPIFRKQIARGGPVTITDLAMSRFIMSIEQSVQLVISSSGIAKGGEVFITKMPVVRIADLARVMIAELAPTYGYMPEDISVEVIGSKPGEKLYEELMSGEETRRSVELKNYFSVTPAFRGLYQDIEYNYSDVVNNTVKDGYNSANQTFLTDTGIASFLRKNNLLETEADIVAQHVK